MMQITLQRRLLVETANRKYPVAARRGRHWRAVPIPTACFRGNSERMANPAFYFQLTNGLLHSKDPYRVLTHCVTPISAIRHWDLLCAAAHRTFEDRDRE